MVEALAGAMDSTLQDFAQLPQDQKQERAELLRKDAERTLAYFRKRRRKNSARRLQSS